MAKVDVCSVNAVDEEKVARIRAKLPKEEDTQALARSFRVLGDPTRIRLVMALALEEVCVCDLAALLGISVSAISHQLRLLRDMNLVKFRRHGKKAFYSLMDHHVETLIQQAQEHQHE